MSLAMSQAATPSASEARLSIGFINWAHALDHYVMLVFPTVVIGLQVVYARSYAELIALGTPSFIAFGVFSLPAGWLADRWSRRNMMVLFFAGCGLSLAAAHIGFIVAFYMIGSKFGVWAPQDLNYSDAVNTSFPWIAGVAIGVMAATSEEFTFRLFAIPFLGKFTGSRVLAVILPAFFWSFLHSAYPQEPGYIRGIEVGLIGIVAGLVMLRWGILATLTWHYTVDASLVGMLLIRSDNLYFKISGIVVGLAALAPLTLSAISYLRRGQFENVDDLLNAADPAPEISLQPHPVAETAAASQRRYDALTPGMIGFLAICILVGG